VELETVASLRGEFYDLIIWKTGFVNNYQDSFVQGFQRHHFKMSIAAPPQGLF
jgi:hypothetical protein